MIGPVAAGRAAIAVTLMILALGAQQAAASTTGRGEVGGPPSFPLGRPDEGERTTPQIVIGRGQEFDGPVELVAYGWRLADIDQPAEDGICIWSEYPATRETNFESCLTRGESSGGIVTGTQKLGPPGDRWTEFGRWLSPGVERLRVSFHRRGSRRLLRAQPVIAHIGGELQKKLKQPEPLAYYTVKVRGLVPRRAFKVEAVGGSGTNP